MGYKLCYVFFCLGVVWPSICEDMNLEAETDFTEDPWTFRTSNSPNNMEMPCSSIRPTESDIVKRFYAILPYFDRDNVNTAFLHKYRDAIYGMSQGDDSMDREVAFYAAVLTPIVFMQQYRDSWCLLERFDRAIGLFRNSQQNDKKSAVKLLQNFRSVNKKIRSFVQELPGPSVAPPVRTTAPPEVEEEEIHDKRDIKYVKELIKNLG